MSDLTALLDRLFGSPLAAGEPTHADPSSPPALPDGTERLADETWAPPFGQTWPARWKDGRCVRCDGRRWRWSQAESRWLCAACGVNDPDRPLTRPVAAPEPSDASPLVDGAVLHFKPEEVLPS